MFLIQLFKRLKILQPESVDPVVCPLRLLQECLVPKRSILSELPTAFHQELGLRIARTQSNVLSAEKTCGK